MPHFPLLKLEKSQKGFFKAKYLNQLLSSIVVEKKR